MFVCACTSLAQDRVLWQVLANMIMNIAPCSLVGVLYQDFIGTCCICLQSLNKQAWNVDWLVV